MKILAIACQKGGVGKTTLSINLSAAFALMESFENPADPGQVLLIDMDKQHQSSKILAGGRFGDDSEEDENQLPTLGQCLIGKIPLSISDITLRSSLPLNSPSKNLHYVPSFYQGMKEAENFLKDETTGRFRLSGLLRSLENSYKYVVIDTPPDLNIMTDNALVAATHAVVPIDAQVLSMDALNMTLNRIEEIKNHPNFNPGLQRVGIVLTKCKLSQSDEMRWLNTLKTVYGDEILSPITSRGDVHASFEQKLDIFSYKPPRGPESIASSNLATQEYAKVADEIKKIIDKS